ncbi:Molybdopterin_biosynthesis MoeB protein [Hexamita inflata]|uniref:Molybdopterin biosynthesis MoeB protein n=1 Tax=Hexamita inflata TaxID=28002 RepID=A0AA86RT78_9EUKA|nr:Molybdopterin biosynthesis MoeB protein [Hexamita inflata]CAI9927852.1 Molybdopterin biosynthesis MoeB protein [Hexamita inflata]CAI9972110.1 Molybdopterin biosynthesis MoeB protein [Hexamita inflata]
MYTQEQIFQRFILCKGADALKAMQGATVIQLGVGAVGGFCCEILARCGLGQIILVDFDTVDISNVNRQIVATTKTVGQNKTEIMKNRVLEINPEIKVTEIKEKVDGKRVAELIELYKPTVICDCIDMFVQKCEIIKVCLDLNVSLVSSMGAARKTDPGMIKIVKLNEVNTCPLAKRIKKTLEIDPTKEIKNIKCILSSEKAMPHPKDEEGNRLSLPSFSVITTVFGVWVAHATIQRIVTGW